MPWVGEVEGEQGGCELGRPQGTREETGRHARCAPMGGVRLPPGLDGDAHGGARGPVCGCVAGALDAGAPQRRGRRRTVGVMAPGGGQEPGRVPMGLPGGAAQRAGLGGQWDVPVLGALATLAMAVEAWASAVRALEGEGGMEPEAHARERGAGDLGVSRGGGGQEPPACCDTAHSREMGGGVRTQACEGGPVTLADVWREEAEAAGAEAPGRWGEAVAGCAVQAGALQLLCRTAVGGGVGERREQADGPERGLLGTRALAAAW